MYLYVYINKYVYTCMNTYINLARHTQVYDYTYTLVCYIFKNTYIHKYIYKYTYKVVDIWIYRYLNIKEIYRYICI